MQSRTTKAVSAVAAVVAISLAGGWALHQLWSTAKSHFTSDSCTIGAYELDTDQAAVASTMVGAVTRYHRPLPERATVLVLAAGLQESKLRNLAPGAGDRDSVGVLQQRPSQNWGGGDPAVLTDVGEATTEFLDALVKVPHWRRLPLGKAVQKVQISADASGLSYAQHEVEARALADALQGIKPAAITCSFEKPTIVADPAKVATQTGEQLGITTPRSVGDTVRVPGAKALSDSSQLSPGQ